MTTNSKVNDEEVLQATIDELSAENAAYAAELEKLKKDLEDTDSVIAGQAAYIHRQRAHFEQLQKLQSEDSVVLIAEELSEIKWWLVWLQIVGDFSTVSLEDHEAAVCVQGRNIQEAILNAKLQASAVDNFTAGEEDELVGPDQYIVHRVARAYVDAAV